MRDEAVDLGPEPGWQEVTLRHEKLARQYAWDDPQGDRIRLRLYRRAADGAAVGKVWFGPGATGHPGLVHGGAEMVVLDEAMGAAAWLAGANTVAGEVTTRFLRPLPAGRVTRLEGWVESDEPRKLRLGARLLGEDGAPYCEATGIFVKVSAERLAAGGR